MSKVTEAKLALIGIIQNLPLEDDKSILHIVESMVEDKVLRRSAPPSNNNYVIVNAMKIINHQLQLTRKEEGIDVLPFD